MRLLLVIVIFLTGCGSVFKKQATEGPVAMLKEQPLEGHEAQELNSRVVDSYVYGEGLGDSVIKVGTAVVFPPFILVMLGNAALSASGYEPVGVSSVLPEPAADGWKSFYNEVSSTPGRVSAGIAGKKYVESSPSKTIRNYLDERKYLAQVF